MRHSQQLQTGKTIQVYSADMRRAVSLQFYPDGYELVEAEPTLISEGYSSHKASSETFTDMADAWTPGFVSVHSLSSCAC